MQPDCMRGDTFDVRDVTKRYEELEMYREDINLETPAENGDGEETPELLQANAEAHAQWLESDEGQEFKIIEDFLDSIKGYGGDQQWRGDWYPVYFIADSYFVIYAQDFAATNKDLSWPYTAIDWDAAAKDLQQDYSAIEIDGDTYWYR